MVSAGGRVLSITGVGADLDEARARAYMAMWLLELKGSYYRKDIAAAAAAGLVTIP